ncbi:MAG: SDR family oxidoreductase [Pyrinomonadaceae bacterium]|nr:SDR family oxidoreductase [Pyrinomonadaceae bacterium]
MSIKLELENQVALVTGAGAGIGKATAILFAAQGAKVGVLDDNEQTARETFDEIRAAGGEASLIIADIAKPAQMENAVKDLVKDFGGLNVVFANAGINGVLAPLDELKPEEWSHTIDNNLTGTFLTVKYAIPHLKKAGGGSIIITSSINGTRYFSNPGATAYACSKAAQIAFGQMAALELAKYKIRVNVVCPGAIATDIEKSQTKRNIEKEREPVETPEGNIPLTDGEKGSSEQVADLVLFLASDKSSHISGTPIFIDGAQSLLV